jgi:hypothetical protein
MRTIDQELDRQSQVLEQHLRRLAEAAPRFTADQRSRLAVLLRPAPTGERRAA